MDTVQRELEPVEQMSDERVLAAFDTAEDPARRGFDQPTYARVLAHEVVRARARLSHYRTLYASYLDTGKAFMVENLDDGGNGRAVPAKLVFSDDAEHVLGIEATADVVVWTEAELLYELTRERTILDFLTGLLDELEPAVLR
jgi:hypothetical protein